MKIYKKKKNELIFLPFYRRSGDGNGGSGSGSVACIGSSSSSSGKHRRKSPTILKREIESTTPHIPSADLLPGKSLEESITFDDSVP